MTRDAYLTSPHRHSTPFWQIFGNLQLVTVTCTACNNFSQSYERAHALALELPDARGSNISALLRTHLAPEQLDEDFRCTSDACGLLGHGTKSTEVLHWPPVLALSLKRFAYNPDTHTFHKINHHVTYGMHLPDIDNGRYQLRAVIEHQGPFGAGHYVACVRSSTKPGTCAMIRSYQNG